MLKPLGTPVIVSLIAVIISFIAAGISFYYSRQAKDHAETVLLNDFIIKAATEFEKKGTPVNYIRSLVLPDKKKEIIWKHSHLLYKGTLPERLFSDLPPPTSSAVAFGFNAGDERFKSIVRALGNGQYEDRTVRSISEEIDVPKGEVEKTLQSLRENGLVKKKTAKDGTYWSFTEEGWRFHDSVFPSTPRPTNKNANH
jgi:hypothetical protein